MKIAFILPSLANTGPIIVARDIINTIIKISPDNIYFTVFYFDDKVELSFNCDTIQIDFKKCIRFDQFDIIHSHGYRPDKYLFKNRKHINIKKISTIHCDVFEDLKHSYNSFISLIFGRLWIHYLNKMDQVITLTKYHKHFYSKHIDKNKICVINNGRELSNLEIDESDQILFSNLKTNNPNTVVIGSFAGLSSIKGLDQIIRSLPTLKDYIYIVIGDGDQKKKLLNLSTQLGVADRCYFLGYRQAASRYFKYIDIFAIPSHSEAFPLALIEATLSGKSCVCSDIPVLKEVFTDSEVSFFKLDDIKSLIAAIKEAKKNIMSKGNNSLKIARRNYTSEIMAKNYLYLYNSITKHHG